MSKFPVSIAGLQDVRQLMGESRPKLVKDPATGNTLFIDDESYDKISSIFLKRDLATVKLPMNMKPIWLT